MAWIRVETGVGRRKVAYRLAEWLTQHIGVSADASAYLIRTSAVGLLVNLWGAVAEHCDAGDVTGVPDLLLEDWANWHGTPGAFAAWVREKHVDDDGRIRDWDEVNGPLDSRREGNRRAAAAKRERDRAARNGKQPPKDDRKPVRKRTVSADVSVESGINVRTYERTDVRSTSPNGEEELSSESSPAPTAGTLEVVEKNARPLPALTTRTAAGVRERLALVTSEIAEGARNRLTKLQIRKLAASIVFAYWQAKTGAGDQTLLDAKRETTLMNALLASGDNVSEMFYAIDGALRDPFYSGKKDGTPKLKISVLFRSRERVEELAELIGDYKRQVPHPMYVKYSDALRGDDE